jgi:hypothetical protein
MQNVGSAPGIRGIYVVSDADLQPPAAQTEKQRSELIVDEHRVVAVPRKWLTQQIQILRPDQDYKRELAGSTDAFSSYLMRAIDENAKFFLPEKPTQFMTRDRVVFSHRANEFLKEATELAKELFPNDREARDRAYSAVDAASLRLYTAVYGVDDQHRWPRNPAQWARTFETLQQIADSLANPPSWTQLLDEMRADPRFSGLKLGGGGPHITDSPRWWDRVGMTPRDSDGDQPPLQRTPGQKLIVLDMCHGLDNTRGKRGEEG